MIMHIVFLRIKFFFSYIVTQLNRKTRKLKNTTQTIKLKPTTSMLQRKKQKQGKHLGVGESREPGEEGESKHPRSGRHEHGIHAACFRGRWQPVARHRADEARRVTGEGHRGEGREGGEVDGAVEEEAEPLQLQEMARRRV